MPIVFSLLGGAFVLSLFLTYAMISLGRKLGVMDEPDERRVHLTPIPRAGGIAIWLSFLAITWGAKLVFPQASEIIQYKGIVAFTASSFLLMVVGFIDDRRGVSALLKLSGQVAAALLYFALDSSLWKMSILRVDLPIVFSCIFFTGWCVLLINAFNLIDGLDGLCSGLVLVSLFVLAGLEIAYEKESNAVMMLTMAAAVGGFIRFNLHPAKIFLGDAGSMMLGFFLATSATQIGGEKAVVGSIMLPIAIAGVPLLDVLLAIWRRSARNYLKKSKGEEQTGGILTADKDHLHHRFLELGLTQRKVAFLLQGVAVLLVVLSFIPMMVGGRGLVMTLCGFIILGLFGLRHFARVELLQAGSMLHLAVKRRKGSGGTRALYYLYDIIGLTAAGFLAMVIETNLGSRNYQDIWSVNYLILFVTFQVLSLQVLKIYRRVWSRSSISEFFLVAIGLTVGAMITSSLWSASKDDVTWSDFRCGFIGAQFAIWFVLIPRALPEVVRELSVDSKHRKLVKLGDDRKHILIYGAGTIGNLFVDYIKNCAPEEFYQFQISGFLDENESLKNRTLQGFKVIGGLDYLEEFDMSYPLDGVLVAISQISEERMKKVFEVASKANLKVYRWQVDHMPREITFDSLRDLS